MTTVRMTLPMCQRCEMEVDGTVRRLTPAEATLAMVLLLNRGRIVAMDTILGALWPSPDDEPDVPEWVVRTHMKNLRRKGLPAQTVRGRGYTVLPA